MSTPNKGSRRLATDTTHTPLDSSRHDAAAPDHRAHSDAVQVHTGKRPSTNFVLPRGPLIGREHEIATIQQLLLQEQVGVLTLTGPGGIGKTRLAMQVATSLLDHFVDGVYFVSLAPIRDAALVIVAIAETLGVREAGTQPLIEALQVYLQHRQMLLVLDNFEQVLAAAPLLTPLLAECDRLKFLVTSRASLDLYGEQEFPVPPLALPDPKWLTTRGGELAPHLAQIASVTLFVQRALAVQPDFALSATNAAAVGEICIDLDGLPLAIELAAAKLKLFSPPALLARLQQRLTLLIGGPQDLPARQRTLRDEIAWSYDLLAPVEQILFRRLAVFAGGFTLEAAQAVCNVAGDLGVDILHGVTSLMEQNLLKQAQQTKRAGEHLLGAEARFHMLETLREYALEQLIASGEAEAIRRQHTIFFLMLVEKIAPALEGAGQALGLVRLTAEYDNLQTALAWSQGEGGGSDIGLRLASALAFFWLMNGFWSEGRRWLEGALAHAKATEYMEVRAHALSGAGELAAMQGDHAAARTHLEECLRIASELGTKRLVSFALTNLSFLAHGQHDDALATAQLEEALAIARDLEDWSQIASVLVFLGNLASDRHDYTGAQALYEEGLAIFQKQGDGYNTADTLAYLGRLAQTQGDYARAGALFIESLTRWKAIGTFQWKGVADCLNGLAGVCALHHQFEETTRLFGAAESLRELLRGSPSALSRTSVEDKHAALLAELGETAFAAAWAAGRALSAEEAVDYALALPAISASAPAPVHSGSVLPSPATYPAGLTTREVEVLRLLAQELTYDQIAEQLIISPRTVNRHLTTIYTKLNVSSRHAATRFALDHHLV
jgi:predicted ATPase/DNA-binding CsgD family transcriptional regulator